MNDFSGALHTAERLRLALEDSLLQRNSIAASRQKTGALIDVFNTEIRTVVSTGAVASLEEARRRLASTERRSWPTVPAPNGDGHKLRGAVGDFQVFEVVVKHSSLRFEVRGPSPFVSSRFGSLPEALDAAHRFAAAQME